MPFKTATSSRNITPDRAISLAGQMVQRMGEYTRDPLEVNAVVIEQTDRRYGLVSCDLLCLDTPFIDSVVKACLERHGVDHVLIACTHTHVGPCTRAFDPSGEVDDGYLENLRNTLVEAIGECCGRLEETRLYADCGYSGAMGWNRIGLRQDGSAALHWGSWNSDFCGVEGPRDGDVPVIFALRPDGSVQFVITGFATHPNCVAQGSFYSADLPGETRRLLRSALGPELGVVYLTGAAGDTSPHLLKDNPDTRQPWHGEEGLIRSGRNLAGVVLQTLAGSIHPIEDETLALERREVAVPIRPWPEDFDIDRLDDRRRERARQSREAWPDLVAKENPVKLSLNVLRIGDVAVCTNPGELYCRYGLAVKSNSPARVTLISELTDGYVGYIPTPEAIGHGAYGAYPLFYCKLVPEAGDIVVDTTMELLWSRFERKGQAESIYGSRFA